MKMTVLSVVVDDSIHGEMHLILLGVFTNRRAYNSAKKKASDKFFDRQHKFCDDVFELNAVPSLADAS